MKIALVNPNPSKYPPLGLATIASYLLDDGHNVRILEGTDISVGEQDLIGIGGLTMWMQEIKQLIQTLPSNIPTVVGGPCITAYPQTFLSLGADYGVIGEGEQTICELVDALENSKPLEGIGGLKHHGQTKFTARPFMSLKNKKVPAWELLPKLDYPSGLGVETSRGCPFNCVWCSAPLISGREWRARPVGDIVDEIDYLIAKFHPKRIYFADDNCTVDPKRWLRLCWMLAQRRFDVEFHVPEGIQAHHLDRRTLFLMKRAGFKRITIGAESGSQRVLDKVIDKGGLKVTQVEQVVKNCVEIGFKISCFFVVGTYGETLGEIWDTLHFARHLRKLGAESCSIRNALPIPGTRMWSLAEADGNLLITEDQAGDHELLHSGKHFMKSREWRPEQVEELTRRGKKDDLWHRRWKHKRHSLKRLFQKVIATR